MRVKDPFLSLLLLLLITFFFGCGLEKSVAPEGALVAVSMDGQVGVLLDEIPPSMKERIVSELINKPDEFWQKRAKRQLALAGYRLVYRDAFYASDDTEEKRSLEKEKQALPLPPESLWEIKLTDKPRQAQVEGHNYVLIDYTFFSTLLTDKDSPGRSDSVLETRGGTWNEPLIFPMDPELIFQRTRFACIDEAEYPAESLDPEETGSFYDQECSVEEKLSSDGCHQTELPDQSCTEALTAKIGKVEVNLKFERLPWDPELADKVRVGLITAPNSADLIAYQPDFKTNRVNYRYIKADSCSLAENCVGGTGWRRLLQVATSDINTGGKNLEIGPIDYFVSGEGSILSEQGTYEYSACHNHYHFKHYGTLSLGNNPELNFKQGFCLQSTNRVYNNEFSPLYNTYGGCDYQGIGSGWVDQYKIGLTCQWLDITEVDTSQNTVTQSLKFTSNPDQFLCEGTPVLDNAGNPVFEVTEFKTETGEQVFKQKCEYGSGVFNNNIDSYDVTIPASGEGYVTQQCQNGEIGPLRNCGFKKHTEKITCTPGSKVKLRCTIPSGSAPQVVRVCDYSSVLGTSIPCTYNGPFNAQSLANDLVETVTEVMFTCPDGRDKQEEGGAYSLYSAPVFTEDPAVTFNCVVENSN